MFKKMKEARAALADPVTAIERYRPVIEQALGEPVVAFVPGLTGAGALTGGLSGALSAGATFGMQREANANAGGASVVGRKGTTTALIALTRAGRLKVLRTAHDRKGDMTIEDLVADWGPGDVQVSLSRPVGTVRIDMVAADRTIALEYTNLANSGVKVFRPLAEALGIAISG